MSNARDVDELANADDVREDRADAPTPAPVDPGGAHNKGYSADPAPEEESPGPDPIPLAAGPDQHPAVHVPERDNHVRPTGRSEPGEYGPNDRLMGSDR